MKPTSEMTMAVDSSVPNMSQENFGMLKDGNPSGIVPTTSPPPLRLSSPWLMRRMRQRLPSLVSPAGTRPAKCRRCDCPSVEATRSKTKRRMVRFLSRFSFSRSLTWIDSTSSW